MGIHGEPAVATSGIMRGLPSVLLMQRTIMNATLLMSGRGLLCALFLLCVIPLASANEELLRKYLTAYTQYEGIRVSGTVSEYVDEKEVDGFSFQASYGVSTADSLRPYEIGEIVKNPGEPHRTSPYLFKRCFTVKNGVYGEYNRAFLSVPPHRIAMSRMLLREVPLMPGIFEACDLATQMGIDGFQTGGAWGNVEAGLKNMRLQVLAEDTFLDFPCRRVRYTYLRPEAKGLAIELRVADVPTVQVLEYLGTECNDPTVARAVSWWLKAREVKSLQVLHGRLIPTWVVFHTQENRRIEVRVSEVLPLPADYIGTWDYESLTGTKFSGTADVATRDESKREEVGRVSSIRPFTNEEMEAIRRYQLSVASPVSTANRRFPIAMIAANVAAVLAFLVVWRRRKYRRKSS
jgi:hypothetical protein